MAKKEEDSLMAAVMSGFKSAGIETEGTVTTVADYWANTKYIDVFDPVKNRPSQ